MKRTICWCVGLAAALSRPALAQAPPPDAAKPAPDAAKPAEASKKTEQDGKEEKVGRVELAGVSGAESVAAKELKVTITSANWSYGMLLAERNNLPVTDVSLEVDPLVDQKGQGHPISWTVDGVKQSDSSVVQLGARARKTIQFEATLPALGEYATTIAPSWGGAPHQKVSLKVVLERAALNVTLGEPSVFAQDGQLDRSDFSVALHETAGAKVKLQPPILASFVQLQGSGSSVTSIGRDAKLFMRKDGVPIPLTEVDLNGDQSKRVELAIQQASGAGKYEAKLQFQTAGSTPVEKTITLLVREEWYLAALLIGIGVALSGALRWWVNKEKPRLELLTQAYRLAPEIEAALEAAGDAMERDLVNRVREMLAAQLGDIQARRPGADAAAVELLAHRVAAVRAWVPVRVSIRAATDPPRDKYLLELAGIADGLASTAVTLDQLKEHEIRLRLLPAEFRTELKKQQVRDKLELLDNKLAGSDLAALKARVDGMLDKGDFDQATAALTEAGKTVGVAMGAHPSGAGAPAAFAMPTLPAALALSARLLERGGWTELGINAAIGFIAVLLGLKALYVDDLTWGGAGAMFIAFLWGLGLHQFTYGGVGSVLDKVVKGGSST